MSKVKKVIVVGVCSVGISCGKIVFEPRKLRVRAFGHSRTIPLYILFKNLEILFFAPPAQKVKERKNLNPEARFMDFKQLQLATLYQIGFIFAVKCQ